MNEMSPPIGHNSGHVPTPEEIREVLISDQEALVTRRDELIAGFERAPKVINDDETVGKVSDFIKQIAGHIKKVDATRMDSKEPYLAGGRAVDGFFNPIKDSLETAKKDLTKRVTIHQKAKAAEEARIRAEAERKAWAEAEAAEKAAREAAAALKEEADLDNAVAAETAAKVAAEAAAKAKRESEAKAADMSRARGDYGSVSSLRTRWTGEVVDRAKLDLEALREHLPADALEKAVRSFVKAGGRNLRGASIYEDINSVIR